MESTQIITLLRKISRYLHKTSKLSMSFHKRVIDFNHLETKINLYCRYSFSACLTLNCCNFRYKDKIQILYRQIIAVVFLDLHKLHQCKACNFVVVKVSVTGCNHCAKGSSGLNNCVRLSVQRSTSVNCPSLW